MFMSETASFFFPTCVRAQFGCAQLVVRGPCDPSGVGNRHLLNGTEIYLNHSDFSLRMVKIRDLIRRLPLQFHSYLSQSEISGPFLCTEVVK